MARELAESILSLVEGLKQPSPRGRFGTEAPPRPKARSHPRNKSEHAQYVEEKRQADMYGDYREPIQGDGVMPIRI